MQNGESSKTLSGIALALMAGHYLFKSEVLLQAVLILLFLAAFPTRFSRTVAHGWLRLGEALGKINSRIILTMIYFLVLVPVAFCYRRLNRKAVEYYEGKNHDSYFKKSDREFTGAFFEKTW